jgi:hypothetical protein
MPHPTPAYVVTDVATAPLCGIAMAPAPFQPFPDDLLVIEAPLVTEYVVMFDAAGNVVQSYDLCQS